MTMTTAPTGTPTHEDAVDHLADLARQQADQDDAPAWLRALREAALARFLELGLPTTKHEEWRYTSLEPIVRTRFALPPSHATVTAEQVKRFAIPDLTCSTVVFVNGRWMPELTDLRKLPRGATVCSLTEAWDRFADQLETHLARDGEPSSVALTNLNAAMAADGLFVHVPDEQVVEHPIHVLNITTASRTPAITCPRNIIIAGAHAELTVIEHYVSLTDGPYFTNAVTQLDAGDGAIVSHYLLEQESPAAFQISTLLTEQGRSSDVASHTVLLGGRLVRNNVNPALNGEGCACLVNGLYLARGEQHMDNHMRVEHNAPRGDSRQFYKGVLNDTAHTVFSGRIRVARDGQKTDAKQTNANLLLSDTAQATTKPQLEIYADDVKCTHGATVGQIDEEAVFYLMARGIDRDAARAMMIYAFAAESLERMKLEPVRRYLGGLLLKHLPRAELLAAVI